MSMTCLVLFMNRLYGIHTLFLPPYRWDKKKEPTSLWIPFVWCSSFILLYTDNHAIAHSILEKTCFTA